MIEYDIRDGHLAFIRRAIGAYKNKHKIYNTPFNYFEAFFIVRNAVIEQRYNQLDTYEKIQNAIVEYNFHDTHHDKFEATFWQTIWFNTKMFRIHGESWKVWDPEGNYYERYKL